MVYLEVIERTFPASEMLTMVSFLSNLSDHVSISDGEPSRWFLRFFPPIFHVTIDSQLNLDVLS
jgi:hypothetical protein